MRRRTLLTGIAGLAVAAVPAGCGGPGRPLSALTVATGDRGGVYHPLGTAFAAQVRRRWHASASPVGTAGSMDNLRRLAAHRADLVFTTVDAAALAGGGADPFDGRQEFRALAGLYQDQVHVVVRGGGGIYGLTDLVGRTVSTGPAGSGTQVVADRLLAVVGLGAGGFVRRALGVADSVAAMRAGSLDAIFFSGGLPTPSIAALVGGGSPFRLLDLSAEVEVLRSQFGEVYTDGFIPVSVYGTPSVATVGVPNVLAMRQHTGDEVGYQLTKLLFDSRDRLAAAHPEGRQLDNRSALATFPVPMHPGAERYYRETKLDAG